MEVKSEYKVTDSGVIPEDWSPARLDNLVRSDAPICYGILMPGDHNEGGVPVVKVRDIIEAQIQELDLLQTHPAIDAAYKRSRLLEGDILITIRGTTGRVAIVSPNLNGANITQDTARVRLKQSVSNRRFFYALQSVGVQRQIALHTIDQAVKGINIRDVKEIVVALPNSTIEQRVIAEALSDVDGLLGGLDWLITKKRNLKQAVSQQLLTGQTRLPDFSGEWEVVRLGDLFKFKNGLNKGKEYFGYGTPIVNYMDVFGSSKMVCANIEGRVSLTAAERKTFDVHKGDVFFTRTSETVEEIGVASVMLDEPQDTVFSGFVLRARPLSHGRLCDAFKAYCFGTAAVRKQITSKASYTTRALTNGRLLSEVLLRLPSPPEQTAIAEVLTDMDAELEALEQRREKTRALKQAMMQELLTGKTRLV